MKKKIKVAVALSGGVDSSVSAALLKKEGYDLVGVFMHCYPQGGWPCTEDEDRADALKIAQILGIPFRVFDFEKEYREKVLDYFYREYKAGKTPNPDSYCNKEIKFGLFLEKAVSELGVDYIATGHYVRKLKVQSSKCKADVKNIWERKELDSGQARMTDTRGEKYKLLRGVDEGKDQSYFLYMITQEQLVRSLFPVGHLLKSEVRRMAKGFGFLNFNKRGTRGICFIGKVDLKDFLEKEIKKKRGEVVDVDGNVIGEHDGVWFYTIGQRRGFTINCKQTTNNKQQLTGVPVYVIAKDVANNRLVAGWGKEAERDSFTVSGVHWIDKGFYPRLEAGSTSKVGRKVGSDGRYLVRIRHLGELYECRISGDEWSNLSNWSNWKRKIRVKLKQGIRGIASGQDAVFYDGEEVLGGGVIE